MRGPPKALSAGQSHGNSPMRLLNPTDSHVNSKGLIQLPSRRTDNNAVLEKCLTSCHGEILGQAPCDNVDVTRCGNIHNPWLVSLSMLQCHETSAL